MPSARNYSNTGSDATTSGLLSPGDTSATLTSFTGFPNAPFIAALDPDTVDEEVVLVTNVAGPTVTMTRGYDGTTAKTHSAGAIFRHVAVAQDFREANAHVVASTGVHGLTGAVVGTSDVQSLTNKTLVAPSISSPAFTGTLTASAATFSGAVSADALSGVTGAFTGAVTIAGTLGVTGTTTLNALNATTGAFSGTLTGVNATLTGNLSVGGTSTFTGAVTVPTPTLGGHAVPKDYADALGTDAATASTIMRRDSSGNTAVDAVTLTDAPTAVGHATRKDYVDAAVKHAQGVVTGVTTQLLPSGQNTAVNLSTGIRASGVTINSTTNSIDITKTAWYLVSGQIGCLSPGLGRWVVFIGVNGTQQDAPQNRTDTTTNSTTYLNTGMHLIHLNAGDHVQVFARQDTGSDKTLDKTLCFLTVVEVP